MIEQAKIEKAAERAVPRILVVDDDVELCELVAEYLTPEGFEVEAVYDGIRGIESALSGEYSLAILDVMLPGMQGFEVLRQIRAKSRLPQRAMRALSSSSTSPRMMRSPTVVEFWVLRRKTA